MAVDFSALLAARTAELTSYVAATRSVLWHPGQKGGVLENRVREWLRTLLPQSLSVTEGVAYDSHGAVSPQCDVIIYDRASAPVVFDENGTRAIPIECVYGVVEVKTRLDGKELAASTEAMLKLKRMQKTAFKPHSSPIEKSFLLYETPLDHFPLLYYVFAAEGLSADTIAKRLQAQLESGGNRHEVINAITVLNAGTAAYAQPGWVSVPTIGSRAAYLTGSNALLLWVFLLLDLMLAAEMYRPLNYLAYLGDVNFEGTIVTSA